MLPVQSIAHLQTWLYFGMLRELTVNPDQDGSSTSSSESSPRRMRNSSIFPPGISSAFGTEVKSTSNVSVITSRTYIGTGFNLPLNNPASLSQRSTRLASIPVIKPLCYPSFCSVNLSWSRQIFPSWSSQDHYCGPF